MDINVVDLVGEYFKTKDLNFKKVEDNRLMTRFDIKGGTVDVIMEFDEEGSHVHLEGINFIKVPEDKYTAMYPVLNQMNDKYRNVKFVLNEKYGQVVARDDGVIDPDTCGEETFELLIVMVRVINDAYASFMKAIWA